MLKDKCFKWAFLISIATHSALFWQLPRFDILPSKRIFNKLEVTYYQIKDKPKTPSPAQALVKKSVIKENKPKITPLPQNTALTAPITPEKTTVIKTEEDKALSPKTIISKNKGEEKKKEELDKLSKDPIYLTYTQTLHQKIRQIALQNCPKNFSDGAVFVSFTLTSDGALKEVSVVEDKSTKETILKQVAKDSIQEAAPFPKFPESFNQPEITFNVIISFETENRPGNE